MAQRDAEVNAKAQAIAQRDALAKEKADLAAQVVAQTQLATQRQQALGNSQQEIADLHQRIQQFEAQTQENTYRQQLQQEEMIKAEAQIELIKDLLLREPGL